MRDRGDELVLGAAERFGGAPRRLFALEGGGALPFGVALCRHVAEHDDDALQGAVGGTNGRGAVADGNVAAVARQQHGVRRKVTSWLAVARLSGLGVGRRVRSSTVSNTTVDRLADRFRLGPAGQRLRHRVEDRDAALRVGGNHRVADAAQRDGEARLVALAGGARGLLALERPLELGRRFGALGLGHVALAQPLIEDRRGVAQAAGEIVEFLDHAPGRARPVRRGPARARRRPPWSVRGPRCG